MKEYEVTIREILERTITVSAETAEEAIDEAYYRYSSGKEVLDYSDFVKEEIEIKE